MMPSFESIARILGEETVSDAELAYRLDCKRDLVARVREALGQKPMPLPPHNVRLPHEERLVIFSEPVRGGHRRWLGSVSGHGMPVIDCLSVPRIAFCLEYGREPVGRVLPGCGRRLCVAGPHQTDQPMRDAVDQELWSGVEHWTREEFEARTVRVRCGHRRWRGRTTADGAPMAGRTESVYRIAFRLHHGRQPEGQVRHTADCRLKHCVEGAHLTDRIIREAARAGVAA